MLWSLVKIVAFLAVAAALVFGLGWIMETPGEIRIAFGRASSSSRRSASSSRSCCWFSPRSSS